MPIEAGVALHFYQRVRPRTLKDHHVDVADLGLSLLRGGQRMILREKMRPRAETPGIGGTGGERCFS